MNWPCAEYWTILLETGTIYPAGPTYDWFHYASNWIYIIINPIAKNTVGFTLHPCHLTKGNRSLIWHVRSTSMKNSIPWRKYFWVSIYGPQLLSTKPSATLFYILLLSVIRKWVATTVLPNIMLVIYTVYAGHKWNTRNDHRRPLKCDQAEPICYTRAIC